MDELTTVKISAVTDITVVIPVVIPHPVLMPIIILPIITRAYIRGNGNEQRGRNE